MHNERSNMYVLMLSRSSWVNLSIFTHRVYVPLHNLYGYMIPTCMTNLNANMRPDGARCILPVWSVCARLYNVYYIASAGKGIWSLSIDASLVNSTRLVKYVQSLLCGKGRWGLQALYLIAMIVVVLWCLQGHVSPHILFHILLMLIQCS